MSKVKTVMQKNSQLIIPIISLLTVLIFNVIRCSVIGDFSFFEIRITENTNILAGNLINILKDASELAILAMGMTLVTSVSRGQDISVGANAAIAGSVFVSILLKNPVNWGIIVVAILASCVVAMIFGAFNGVLVSVFKIQPMIATLILYTVGRSIAYWINGGATPTLAKDHPVLYLGTFFPGNPIPTPIFIVIIVGIIFALVLKFTNLGLYTQAVGINEKAARLNGINPVKMKMLAFIILGICVALAGVIRVSRLALINHETILLGVEMDAILAVAIGGNSLGGGKFKLSGSIIGAYVIEALTNTLYAMKVASTDVKAYKAVVIIIIVVMGSPIVKKHTSKLWGKLFKKKAVPATAGASSSKGGM